MCRYLIVVCCIGLKKGIIDKNRIEFLYNGGQGICMISSFLDGRIFPARSKGSILKDCVKAMRSVRNSEHLDVLSKPSRQIVKAWNEATLRKLDRFRTLEVSVRWNPEILTFYVKHFHEECEVFFFKECGDDYILAHSYDFAQATGDKKAVCIGQTRKGHCRVMNALDGLYEVHTLTYIYYVIYCYGIRVNIRMLVF